MREYQRVISTLRANWITRKRTLTFEQLCGKSNLTKRRCRFFVELLIKARFIKCDRTDKITILRPTCNLPRTIKDLRSHATKESRKKRRIVDSESESEEESSDEDEDAEEKPKFIDEWTNKDSQLALVDNMAIYQDIIKANIRFFDCMTLLYTGIRKLLLRVFPVETIKHMDLIEMLYTLNASYPSLRFHLVTQTKAVWHQLSKTVNVLIESRHKMAHNVSCHMMTPHDVISAHMIIACAFRVISAFEPECSQNSQYEFSLEHQKLRDLLLQSIMHSTSLILTSPPAMTTRLSTRDVIALHIDEAVYKLQKEEWDNQNARSQLSTTDNSMGPAHPASWPGQVPGNQHDPSNDHGHSEDWLNQNQRDVSPSYSEVTQSGVYNYTRYVEQKQPEHGDTENGTQTGKWDEPIEKETQGSWLGQIRRYASNLRRWIMRGDQVDSETPTYTDMKDLPAVHSLSQNSITMSVDQEQYEIDPVKYETEGIRDLIFHSHNRYEALSGSRCFLETFYGGEKSVADRGPGMVVVVRSGRRKPRPSPIAEAFKKEAPMVETQDVGVRTSLVGVDVGISKQPDVVDKSTRTVSAKTGEVGMTTSFMGIDVGVSKEFEGVDATTKTRSIKTEDMGVVTSQSLIKGGATCSDEETETSQVKTGDVGTKTSLMGTSVGTSKSFSGIDKGTSKTVVTGEIGVKTSFMGTDVGTSKSYSGVDCGTKTSQAKMNDAETLAAVETLETATETSVKKKNSASTRMSTGWIGTPDNVNVETSEAGTRMSVAEVETRTTETGMPSGYIPHPFGKPKSCEMGTRTSLGLIEANSKSTRMSSGMITYPYHEMQDNGTRMSLGGIDTYDVGCRTAEGMIEEQIYPNMADNGTRMSIAYNGQAVISARKILPGAKGKDAGNVTSSSNVGEHRGSSGSLASAAKLNMNPTRPGTRASLLGNQYATSQPNVATVDPAKSRSSSIPADSVKDKSKSTGVMTAIQNTLWSLMYGNKDKEADPDTKRQKEILAYADDCLTNDELKKLTSFFYDLLHVQNVILMKHPREIHNDKMEEDGEIEFNVEVLEDNPFFFKLLDQRTIHELVEKLGFIVKPGYMANAIMNGANRGLVKYHMVKPDLLTAKPGSDEETKVTPPISTPPPPKSRPSSQASRPNSQNKRPSSQPKRPDSRTKSPSSQTKRLNSQTTSPTSRTPKPKRHVERSPKLKKSGKEKKSKLPTIPAENEVTSI